MSSQIIQNQFLMHHIAVFIQPLWHGYRTTKQSRSPASFGELPRELVLEIANHLDFKSLSSLSRTCRGLYELLDPEITKQAPQSALAPRYQYSTSFIYDDGQQHGVDLPSFKVRWSSRNNDSVEFHRMPIHPTFQPTIFEPFGQVTYRGNFDAVQNLLERGANPNAYLVNGARILSVAVESGKMDIVKLLLDFGARPCWRDPGLHTSPLDRAALRGEMDVVRAMISTDLEIDSCITLHDAVYYRKEIVELLIPLMEMSTFNLFNAGGQTALHLAMRDAYVDTAMYLIALPGIDLDIQDVHGWTALHFALHRHILVQALLKAGADIHITVPHGGHNALHVALKTVAISELPAILRELLRHGADINAISSYGTPMHCAVRTRSRTVMKALLLESPNPPDLTIEDRHGQTPIDLAFSCGYIEIGQLLMEYQRSFPT